LGARKRIPVAYILVVKGELWQPQDFITMREGRERKEVVDRKHERRPKAALKEP